MPHMNDPIFCKSLIYICENKKGSCANESGGIADDIKYLYALSWSRFGNLTLYKYNSTEEEFVVQ